MAIIRDVRGKTPKVGENTFLAETAVLIGDVTVGKDCSIWYGAVLRGDVNPIRIGNYGPYKALNYHRWSVCEGARILGKTLGIPVYKALREPIVRHFGEEFYTKLEVAAGMLNAEPTQE